MSKSLSYRFVVPDNLGSGTVSGLNGIYSKLYAHHSGPSQFVQACCPATLLAASASIESEVLPVKSLWVPTVAALVLSSFGPSAAFAHHSMSMYDREHEVSLNATIVTFGWINPHLQIAFDATDENGNMRRWVAEGPGPGRLSNRGWTKDSLKPGDQVIIYGNVNKDGSPTMRFVKIAFPDGHELETGYRN